YPWDTRAQVPGNDRLTPIPFEDDVKSAFPVALEPDVRAHAIGSEIVGGEIRELCQAEHEQPDADASPQRARLHQLLVADDRDENRERQKCERAIHLHL